MARWQTVLEWMIQASAQIEEAGERRNARLLSGLLIIIMVFGLLSGILQLIFVPDFISTFVFILASISILFLCYLGSRTKYYKFSALIASIIPSIGAYSNFVQHPEDVIAVGFMAVGVFLGSMLLSMRTTIGLAMFNIAAVLASPLFNVEMNGIIQDEVIAPAFFIVMLSGLIILSKHHNTNIERDRQAILLKSRQELQTAYDQLQGVLTNLPIMVCALGENEKPIIWNAETQRITGYQAHEIKGTDCASSIFGWKEQSNDETSLLGGKEIIITDRNKQEKTIAYYDMSKDFPIPGWANWGVGMDITEHKAAEAARLKYAVEQENTKMVRTLIGNLSHDLKTPLSIIGVNLDLLERLGDPVKQQERITVIRRQSSQLQKLIEDILTIARLDILPESKVQPEDINQIIRDVSEQLESLAERKGLELKVATDSHIRPIALDKDLFFRAMMNLVENAIAYTDDGSVSIQTHKNGNGNMTIRIVDTGVGIPEKDLPYIFDRFYRGNAARPSDRGGTGLGLAIAKRIITLIGGTIEVESKENIGTTFHVTLPHV